MKVLGINHLAIAHDQSGNFEKVLKVLGISFLKEEDVPDQQVKVKFFPIPSSKLSFELLSPTSLESVIQKFLQNKGPGIHHFCVEVDDVESAMKVLSSHNIKLIYPQAKIGAHHAKINFIHPKDAGGILIEIAQYT